MLGLGNSMQRVKLNTFLMFYCLLCTSFAAVVAVGAEPRSELYEFTVYLDDKPIGEQRLKLTRAEQDLYIETTANFKVKVFGITVFKYTHNMQEKWQNNCVVSLTAFTDSNGEQSKIEVIETEKASKYCVSMSKERQLSGCIRTFAYWQRDLLEHSQLLNVQTGELNPGRLQRQADQDYLQLWQLKLPEQALLIGYQQADWQSLESSIDGKRTIRYIRKNLNSSTVQ